MIAELLMLGNGAEQGKSCGGACSERRRAFSGQRLHGTAGFEAAMFQIARSPCVHGFQHGAYGVAELGERILHTGRDDREDLSVDEAVFLKFAELLGEHFGCGRRHGAAKFGKAHGPGDEFP